MDRVRRGLEGQVVLADGVAPGGRDRARVLDVAFLAVQDVEELRVKGEQRDLVGVGELRAQLVGIALAAGEGEHVVEVGRVEAVRAVDGAQRRRVGAFLRIDDGRLVRRGRIRDDLRGRGVHVVHRVEVVREDASRRVARLERDGRAGRHVVDVQRRIAYAHVVYARSGRGDHHARVERLPVNRFVGGQDRAGGVVGDHLERPSRSLGLERPALALVEVDLAEVLVDDRIVVVVRAGQAPRHELGGVAVFLEEGNRRVRRDLARRHHLVLEFEGLRRVAVNHELVLAARIRQQHERIVVRVHETRLVDEIAWIVVVLHAAHGQGEFGRRRAAHGAHAVLASGLEGRSEMELAVHELAGIGPKRLRHRERLRAVRGADLGERADARRETERGGGADLAGERDLVLAALRVSLLVKVPVVHVEVRHLDVAVVDLVDVEAGTRLVLAVFIVGVVGAHVHVDARRVAAGNPDGVCDAALERHRVVGYARAGEFFFFGVVFVHERRRLRRLERDRLLEVAALLGRCAERREDGRRGHDAHEDSFFHVVLPFVKSFITCRSADPPRTDTRTARESSSRGPARPRTPIRR